ncbi:hypothetical protein TNCT_629121, partial [Trichonephila clavata]
MYESKSFNLLVIAVIVLINGASSVPIPRPQGLMNPNDPFFDPFGDNFPFGFGDDFPNPFAYQNYIDFRSAP